MNQNNKKIKKKDELWLYLIMITAPIFHHTKESLLLNPDAVNFANKVFKYSDFLFFSKIISGIIVVLLSIICFPLINTIINYRFKKYFLNEIIYLKFYNNFNFLFIILNIIISQWIIGETIIPYFLFSNNIQNNIFNLIICILFAVLSLFVFTSSQYSKIFWTNKHFIVIYNCGEIFKCLHEDIISIEKTNLGVRMQYKKEQYLIKSIYICKSKNIIDKIIKIWKETIIE